MNEELHLDMCNFRQSPACMEPGARSAGFIPRGMSKSTIFTHGANSWELLRNPDLRICIVNAIVDKAQEFMHNIKNTFERGMFFSELYPEYVPKKNAVDWNMERLVLPNRSRNFTEPSIKCLGVSGAAEGGHYDLLNCDDLVGMDAVDSNFQSSATMDQAKKWFATNSKALLDSWVTSRITVVATRYAIDDVYQEMCDSCKEVSGFSDGEIVVDSEGVWSVYYRIAVEDGKSIYPEKFPIEALDRIASDPEQRWVWVTQYLNKPTKSGLAEFHQYEIKKARIYYSEEEGDFLIQRYGSVNFEEKDTLIYLKDCDVVMSIDPAATDKGMTAKTSRTSIGVWALHSSGTYYRIWSKVGFLAIDQIIDSIFLGNTLFKGYIRCTIVESNAFQKVIKRLLDLEQEKRGIYINATPKASFTDKKARIRSALGALLSKGALYVCDSQGKEFVEECKVFPMSEVRLDVLDESEKGITALIKPMNPGDIVELELEEEERELAVVGAFGY